MIRSTTVDVTFRHPFDLEAVGRGLPAGTYLVDIDEEQIDGLSFLAYRRLATFIRVPAAAPGSVQSFLIDPQDLAAAQERDLAASNAT